jgi:hypothetical protein
MLGEARADLGMSGRPNEITRWYASRNGQEFLRAPWCDQGITHWAELSGNADAVLPAGDRAYTVWHAEDGERLGRWFKGTAANIRAHAVPASVIFFDWGGTNETGAIDHVGLVEVNLGDGRVQTIEANTGDAVKRRVRGPEVIAGFWTPAYQEEGDMPTAKELWDHEIKVPWGTPDNPEWQADSLLVEANKQARALVEMLRRTEAKIDAQGAALMELVATISTMQPGEPIDVDALVSRIETAIEGIQVRLDVPDPAAPAA